MVCVNGRLVNKSPGWKSICQRATKMPGWACHTGKPLPSSGVCAVGWPWHTALGPRTSGVFGKETRCQGWEQSQRFISLHSESREPVHSNGKRAESDGGGNNDSAAGKGAWPVAVLDAAPCSTNPQFPNIRTILKTWL